ncbi:glycoside hydrolase family 2 protein [Chondrinema litorale]|uniref:glycoside hydrolase family 2 protein n=1 Tax=Chondrinema litorale TaxID=2994555 RepID=UPI0025435671|nr:sugar-binding domain-containing protein [Chondrinema litorale]UZR99549.1 beta-mannosidase [Chondrinema litorale]
MHKYILNCFLLIVALNAYAQKTLWQPYFITPRSGDNHLEISDNWQLTHTDKPIDNLSTLSNNEWINVKRPSSVHWALHWAGTLPYPYAGNNAEKYEWVEKSIWYYKNTFTLNDEIDNNYHFLHFKGIDYFAKIWLNGEYLGEHEGMFGGPTIEISKYVKKGIANELVVEVKSANYLEQESYKSREPGKHIKPWVFSGGSGAEPWFTVGMWQGARVETVPKIHLERPFLYTESLSGSTAELRIKSEIFVNTHALEYEMHPWEKSAHLGGTFFYDKSEYNHYDGKLVLDLDFELKGNNVHHESFELDLFEARNWIDEHFTIQNPKLWWPNGMGDQEMYDVTISLKSEGKVIDKIEIPFGIRTIENEYTKGPQFGDVWNPWQFVVNGKKLFVKGVNWMPADLLLDLPREKYEWILGLAKEAGIQMVRIWGAGLSETEEFYDVCDSLGIMVWQDFPIANFSTAEWPMKVWEAQVAQTIFRLRNRTSLALYNGGNEFNAYGFGNTASIGILERNLETFDPTRLFTRTSPDGGSIHTYPDMDPVWYKERYKWVAYVAETGMHSIPEAKGLYEIVNPAEFQNLGNMYSDEFASTHPEFIQHFVEFSPGRVPRMLSRASHIDDMKNPTIESIAEASQIGSGEFYQIMSEKIQSNYPVTAGLMPWVFKRPWPIVAAIHLVDGNGQPSAPYYFLKRTYEPIHVALDIEWLLWEASDVFPVKINVMNAENKAQLAQVEVKIYNEKFDLLWQKEKKIEITKGPSVSSQSFDDFTIPSELKNQYFPVCVELKNESGEIISRSVYWPRTIPQMEDKEFKTKYKSQPTEWPNLENGPWLKPIINNTKTSIKADLVTCNKTPEGYINFEMKIKNTGKIPAFMCSIDIKGAKRTFVTDDNYFWLAAGEEKIINGKINWREPVEKKSTHFIVNAWNTKSIKLEIK